MNSTSFASRLVRMAARSPGRSSTGPEVWRRLTPISRAMMLASVVLPRPGGPNNSVWSSASPRLRAALMKISSWLRIFSCPTYSSRCLGRRARSIASSLGDDGAASMMRCSVKLSVWMLINTQSSVLVIQPGRHCIQYTAHLIPYHFVPGKTKGWTLRHYRRLTHSVGQIPRLGGSAFGQRFQCLLDAVRNAAAGRHSLQRLQGFLVGVTQRQQCVQDIRLRIRHGVRATGADVRTQLAFQFQQQALGGLLADTGYFDQAARLLQR